MSQKLFGKLPESMRNEAVRPYAEYVEGRRVTRFFKRFFDILISLIVTIILSPIMLAAAVAVACTSRGPVFYRQSRVGRYNRDFFIFKFRTMVVNADKMGTQITVGTDDPRITRVGAFLRKTRIDEFPQLLNIIGGSMTLVGTRPEVRRYVDAYTDEMMATLLLRPGVTGTASIAFREENDMLIGQADPEQYYIDEILPRKMAYNLEYTKSFTLFKDFIILLRTVGCVFH